MDEKERKNLYWDAIFLSETLMETFSISLNVFFSLTLYTDTKVFTTIMVSSKSVPKSKYLL